MDKERGSESDRPRLIAVRGTPDVTAFKAATCTLQSLGLEIGQEDLIDAFVTMPPPDPVSTAHGILVDAQREMRRLNALATWYEVEALRRPIWKWKQRRAGNWRRHCIRLAVNVDHLKARLREARAEALARKPRIA